MKIIYIVIFIFLFTTVSAQSQRDLQWKEDIEYLRKQLPKDHIDLFTVKSRKEFNESLENLSQQVAGLTNLEIAIKLQQIVASFGDSHTKVDWYKFCNLNRRLPVYFHWFSDGIFVLNSTEEYQNLLGGKLVKLNDISVDRIVDSLSTMITVDNISCVKKDIPGLMNLLDLLLHFNFVSSDSVTLSLENANGLENHILIAENSVIPSDKFVRLQQLAEPLVNKNSGKYFVATYLPLESIYYIHYNKCWSKELEIKYNGGKNADDIPSFNDFEEKVLKDIRTKDFKKIVFDLRANSGGSSLQGSLFIKKLMETPKVQNNVKVFVVVGRYTFSSAVLNAMDFSNYANVTYVGEETSGTPNHFGEVKKFHLPNSKLGVQYSTKYFQRTGKIVNSLKPDVEFSTSIKDYLNGTDLSFEFIIQD